MNGQRIHAVRFQQCNAEGYPSDRPPALDELDHEITGSNYGRVFPMETEKPTRWPGPDYADVARRLDEAIGRAAETMVIESDREDYDDAEVVDDGLGS